MRSIVERVFAPDNRGESLLRAGDPLAILIALFLFNRGVPKRLVGKVFGTRTLRFLEEMRLIDIDAAMVTSHLSVFPCQDLYVVTDAFGNHGVKNKVMPLCGESYDLGTLAIRKGGRWALDLCTGSGVHALLASRHCRDVVAVDISPRAIAFSEFNAWFNAIPNVEFRRGDLYGPVDRAHGYDLITANPPYNPELTSLPGEDYYSGGESGEEVSSRIVAGVPEFLNEGGYGHIVTLLIHREGDTIRGRTSRWMGAKSARFDVLILSRPVDYRPEVLRGAAGLPPSARVLHESWKRQKISGFAFGMINLRWTPAGGTPLYVQDALDNSYAGVKSVRIQDVFEAATHLRERP